MYAAGTRTWLLDAHPFNPTTGARIPVRQITLAQVQRNLQRITPFTFYGCVHNLYLDHDDAVQAGCRTAPTRWLRAAIATAARACSPRTSATAELLDADHVIEH